MIRSSLGEAGHARVAPSDEVIRESEPAHAVRWTKNLVWFMRGLALAWIVKGLLAWAVILGIWSPATPFEEARAGYQAAMIYFAAIDLVAAVGLWMTTNWGGILWLLAVMSHLILAVFFPRFVSNSALVFLLFITCIMVYLTLSWLAAVEE